MNSLYMRNMLSTKLPKDQKMKNSLAIKSTLKISREIKFILLSFLILFGTSCTSDEFEVIPENAPQAPEQEAAPDANAAQFALAGCTDERALNSAGASFDDNSCQYTPMSSADVDYVVNPGEYKLDNNVLKLPAGSVIGIKGQDRGGVYIINFHGTPENPFTFINVDGQTTITKGDVGIKVHESSNLRITGTGSTDDYGFKITTSLHGVQAEHGTTDYEVDHIEIGGSGATGFSARSNPEEHTNRSNFVQKNTSIHHNYIHNTGNEGLYLGGSHWHTSWDGYHEPELKGVRVYNNRIENTGRDGIQVGSAVEDSEIYNNVVKNYGLNNITIHQSGLQINPGTTGKIYNNYIEGGNGHAIFLSGFGNDVYNNVIVDCKRSGFYLADREPYPNQSYRIFNNTLVNVREAAVKMQSTLSVSNVFYNNALINVGTEIIKGVDMDIDVANNFTTSTVAEALFIDAANLDFTPTADSPLIDGGKDVSTIDIKVQADYLFHSRTTGGGIDIGAIELQK